MHLFVGFFHKRFKQSKTNRKRKKSKEFQLGRRLLHGKNHRPTKNNTRITNNCHSQQRPKRSLSLMLLRLCRGEFLGGRRRERRAENVVSVEGYS